MKTCVVCGETFAPSTENQTACSTCKKNYSRGSLVSVQRAKSEGRRGIDNSPLPTVSEWIGNQRIIAKRLGLNQIDLFLGKLCEKCNKPAQKGAHMSLCSFHYSEYRREKNRIYKQRSRTRSQQ